MNLNLARPEYQTSEYQASEYQNLCDAEDMATNTSLYSTERSFTAAKYEETTWNALFQQDPESYAYHLALEISKLKGYRIGYAAVKRGGIVVCIAPYFVCSTKLMTQMQLGKTHCEKKVRELDGITPPHSLTGTQDNVIYIGSPVSKISKIGFTRDFLFDTGMLNALNLELEHIAQRERASAILFNLSDEDSVLMAASLLQDGYLKLEGNTRVISKRRVICKTSNMKFEQYIQPLESGLEHAALKHAEVAITDQQPLIEEFSGLPGCMEELYRFYAENHASKSLATPLLTLEYFECVAGLLPNNCIFITYRSPVTAGESSSLIGFRLLLKRENVMAEVCFAGTMNLTQLEQHDPCDSPLHMATMHVHTSQFVRYLAPQTLPVFKLAANR